MRRSRRLLLLQDALPALAAGFLAISAATGAAADTATEDAAAPNTAARDDSGGIQEIVVTARKRSESLLSVPDSITVIGPEEIVDRRLNQIGDFLALTPNVNMVKDQDAATNIISIRGIGANRNQAASVAFVVDGVILPDSDAFTTDLSDAERVEVLKGPQGALYGKGAIAGAINITTKAPTVTPEVDLRASYGTGNDVNVFAGVSGPVTDQLRGSVSLKVRNFDGIIDNQYTGRPVDSDEFKKLSARLIFDATDFLSFDLHGSYLDQKAGASGYSESNVLGTTGGRITSEAADVRPDFDSDPQTSWRTISEGSLTGTLKLDAGTITSISAYDDIDVKLNEELDWSPLPLIPNVKQRRATRGYSEELRFTSPDGNRLRYIVGAYYQNTKRGVDTNGIFDLCVFLPTSCIAPLGAVTGVHVPLALQSTLVRSNTHAGFGQVNYDITRQLELTLALRYDRDQPTQNDYLGASVASTAFSSTEPKASLAYKVTDALTFYSTYSQGYKSGTFNPTPPPGAPYPLLVRKEATDNFELGMKSALLERRLLFNLATFLTNYRDPQIFQFDAQTGGQYTINAQRARLKGGEFDLTAKPTAALDLNASFGYTNSEILRFDASDRYIGQALPNMPQYTLNVGGQYRFTLPAALSLTPRIDYNEYGRTSYQDFQNPDPNAYVYQPAYGTLDAQLALAGRGNWAITVYGKNLTSTHYVTSAFSRYSDRTALVPLDVDLYQIAEGATVGVEARVTF